ncbi:MAG: hypothetical protein P4L45_07665, partial [Ignavibacteriaceae bacterium]|nr:hypothetical protein [Ignavibacteriaceae bacterium]
MEFYRVDKKLFKVKEIILPDVEYKTSLNVKGTQLEAHLEKYRSPDKTQRDKHLFVFSDLIDAKDFCRKMIYGKIYKVSVRKNDILHKG